MSDDIVDLGGKKQVGTVTIVEKLANLRVWFRRYLQHYLFLTSLKCILIAKDFTLLISQKRKKINPELSFNVVLFV